MNKNKFITLRVTEEEYIKIKEKAKKSKVTLSKYVAFSALDKNIIVIDGMKDVAKQLIKIGTNLNQLVVLCHEGKISCLDLSQCRKEIHEIWQLLNSLTDPINPPRV
ncbi:MobC family plasmid mobilization relaxosome protein [Desnuesiella massiliensis]|uniref:MobC family plasmid mobilization relaxosome protein n=1 Tax=Desnuesiella massiliensis TaxID=1650662 RepID=UPI0006E3D1E7|nr:MobC family plasmid mobilization relaxosome protein [Desnuesiella massiliensis]